jgi:SprT protein
MKTGMTRDHLAALLEPKLPDGTLVDVLDLVARRPLVVRFVPPRRTKLGDYRPPQPAGGRGWWRADPGSGRTAGGSAGAGDCHRITLNVDLNPFALLTTLLHEIAHLVTHERHLASGRRRRPRPHGPEWKEAFGGVLAPIVDRGGLPRDVADALASFLADPPAATCTDRRLTAVLRRYDPPQPGVDLLENLPESALFRLACGRAFRRGRKLRKTFFCEELSTGRGYRVRSDALVSRFDTVDPAIGPAVESSGPGGPPAAGGNHSPAAGSAAGTSAA